MAMTDPIADMLARIRNASRANRGEVDMPFSKLKADIARILKEEGFIKEYRVLVAGSKKEMTKDDRGISGKHKVLRIFLRYGSRGEKMIRGILRVSKPGCRVYIASSEVKKDYRMPILSTSHGVMSGFESHKKGIGGELLRRVW